MKVRRSPSIIALMTAGALVALTGCSSSSSTEPADVGGSDGLAAVQAFAALPSAEQEQELRTLTASMDRQLMTLSGLEAELGGSAQADAAYAAVSAGILDLAQGFVEQPDFGRFGARIWSEDAPSIGGLMFGNLMIGALVQGAAITSIDNAPGGGQQDLADRDSGGKGSLRVSGDLAKSQLEVGGEFTAQGVTGKLNTLISVSACPDAKGEFTSTTTMTASVTSAGGRTGSNLTIEVAITGQVDDDAHLASYDVDVRTQSAEFANSKGMYADQSVGWTVGGSKWSNYRTSVNRTGGKVTDAFMVDQAKWGQFMSILTMNKAVEAAKQGWESGRCVALEPTTSPGKRTGLKPSAGVTITAAPRSKVDGKATGGTVTATLNGDSSVDPAGSKVPADATFAYVAAGEKDKSATVSLEARSKRGVAKASVAFDTKAGGYVASGGGSRIAVSGTVSDLTAPFTLQGKGAGFTVTFAYTPSSADGRSGSLTYSGKGGGVSLKGTGTYTIAGTDGEVLTMTSKNQGCATPGGCRSNTETITLTPTS